MPSSLTTAALSRRIAPGAKVGTSSLRRRIQLLISTPRFGDRSGQRVISIPVFGNFERDVLMASSWQRGTMSTEARKSDHLPVPCRRDGAGDWSGMSCLEVREDDARVLEMIKDLDHLVTRQCVTAERVFLEKMGGGCQVPMGAYAVSRPESIEVLCVSCESIWKSDQSNRAFVGGTTELEDLVRKR